MLSVVWGILIILWTPFDLIFLTDHQGASIAIARIVLAIYLFSLARFNNQLSTLKQVQWYMGLMVCGLNLFYLYAISVLEFPVVYTGFEYGYTLLPILHVAILTILPVTLKESFYLLVITATTQLFVHYHSGHIFTPESISDYWLQNALALMVIWSQLSKLYMLMRLYRQATLDPLTGVYNRRMLLQLAQKSLIKCEARNAPFSVLFFDIDKFKRINDTWGHGVGDKVLRGFTDFVQTKIRKTDLFGRYGGEEFVLFLPHCNQEMALSIAERMQRYIRHLELPMDLDQNTLKITTCIGISTYSSGDTLSSLIERADRALYECKDSGRDCYRFHPVGYKYQGNERRKAYA